MVERWKPKEESPAEPAPAPAPGGHYFLNEPLRFIRSGCTPLDCVIGGGWPLGRVVNIVGDRCLSGDTVVSVQRGTKPRKMTMRDLFRRAKGEHWNRNGDAETYLIADVGGYVGTAKMLDVVASGEKVLYEVTTDRGMSLQATEDHKFSTAEGWMCLADNLGLGTAVKCWRGTRGESGYTKKPRAMVYSIPFHPFGWANVVAGRDYKRMLAARLVIEAAINGLTPSELIRILRTDPDRAATLQYTDPGMHIHHLDGDPTNDRLENLQLVWPAEHWELHADELAPNSRPVELAEIVSIRRIRKQEETFDVTMEAPHHNFVANGLVVHNSTGKTLLAIEAAANIALSYPKSRIWYRESEAAFDIAYAEVLGLPTKRIDFGPSGLDTVWDTIEDVLDDLDAQLTVMEGLRAPFEDELAKARKRKRIDRDQVAEIERKLAALGGLYVIDSLDALTSRAALKRKTGQGSFNLEKPKVMAELFSKLVRRTRQSGVCLIFISQTRDNIGVTFGDKQTRSGGNALDFYASVVLWLHQVGMIHQEIRGVKRTIGIDVRARAKKNKIAPPFRECRFPIRFSYGIDDLVASLEYLESVKLLDMIGIKGKSQDELGKALDKYISDTEKLPQDQYLKELQRVRESTLAAWNNVETGFLPKRSKYGA